MAKEQRKKHSQRRRQQLSLARSKARQKTNDPDYEIPSRSASMRKLSSKELEGLGSARGGSRQIFMGWQEGGRRF